MFQTTENRAVGYCSPPMVSVEATDYSPGTLANYSHLNVPCPFGTGPAPTAVNKNRILVAWRSYTTFLSTTFLFGTYLTRTRATHLLHPAELALKCVLNYWVPHQCHVTLVPRLYQKYGSTRCCTESLESLGINSFSSHEP